MLTSNISRMQGKTDLQRSKLYGKMGKQIAQAAREGGADPQANDRLRDLMEIARATQVPAPTRSSSDSCCRGQLLPSGSKLQLTAFLIRSGVVSRMHLRALTYEGVENSAAFQPRAAVSTCAPNLRR